MKMKRVLKNECGSMMMEYVVLNLLFIVVIIIAGYFFVDSTGQFGILGDAFVQRYELLRQIVSMPYP